MENQNVFKDSGIPRGEKRKKGLKVKKWQMENPRGIDAPEKFRGQGISQERSQGISQGRSSQGISQGRSRHKNKKCRSYRQCHNGQYCDTLEGQCFEEKNVTFKGACERNGGKFLLFPIIKIHSKTEVL